MKTICNDCKLVEMCKYVDSVNDLIRKINTLIDESKINEKKNFLIIDVDCDMRNELMNIPPVITPAPILMRKFEDIPNLPYIGDGTPPKDNLGVPTTDTYKYNPTYTTASEIPEVPHNTPPSKPTIEHITVGENATRKTVTNFAGDYQEDEITISRSDFVKKQNEEFTEKITQEIRSHDKDYSTSAIKGTKVKGVYATTGSGNMAEIKTTIKR